LKNVELARGNCSVARLCSWTLMLCGNNNYACATRTCENLIMK
jgi:hypothetical protein